MQYQEVILSVHSQVLSPKLLDGFRMQFRAGSVLQFGSTRSRVSPGLCVPQVEQRIVCSVT
jgi:hypothetical protein